MMNRIILFALVMSFLPSVVLAQTKRPTLMVIPADSWCQANGFTMNIQDVTMPDYEKAWQNSQELTEVITKIGELMSERDFPIKDMSQSLKNIGQAKADIFMEVGWQINKMGPKRSVTYTLRGIDAYTMKQIAAGSGTGKMSFSAEIPVLLEEAVLERMDNFCDQLQNHFDDLLTNGREVRMSVRIDGNTKMSDEYEGQELSEVIEDWLSLNTVEHRYSLSDATESFMNFDQVRIPLYADNGMAMDTRRFVQGLRKRLMELGVSSQIETQGLGMATLIICMDKKL
ncbi:DUF6175 family protein [Xylanibacter ruminicola]|nr:DUF6175 family protein [Xylanibacter ruminicola]